MIANARERVIVALDTDNEREALSLVEALRDQVKIFKVGLELLCSAGIGIVPRITALGADVFLDGKFMDIPNTVAGASRSASKVGVRMFNVHCLSGIEAMRAAVEATHSSNPRPLVLGVTILTSIDQAKLNKELGIAGDLDYQVVRLAQLALAAGLDGVIASPQETTAIRKAVSKDMLIVTPGVRPLWASLDDQRRTTTPGEAIRNGASYIVVGRPITRPPANVASPTIAAQLILDEVESELSKKKEP